MMSLLYTTRCDIKQEQALVLISTKLIFANKKKESAAFSETMVYDYLKLMFCFNDFSF